MPNYQVNRDRDFLRVTGAIDELPAVMLESSGPSETRLIERGVAAESFVYAPLVREGEQYSSDPGDHFRVVSMVSTPEGLIEVITEVVDVGTRSPVAVIDVPYSPLSDEERALIAEQNAALNAAALESALNQAAPFYDNAPPTEDSYSPEPQDSIYGFESVPYTAPQPNASDPGYVQSAPIAQPSSSYQATSLPSAQEQAPEEAAPPPQRLVFHDAGDGSGFLVVEQWDGSSWLPVGL